MYNILHKYHYLSASTRLHNVIEGVVQTFFAVVVLIIFSLDSEMTNK